MGNERTNMCCGLCTSSLFLSVFPLIIFILRDDSDCIWSVFGFVRNACIYTMSTHGTDSDELVLNYVPSKWPRILVNTTPTSFPNKSQNETNKISPCRMSEVPLKVWRGSLSMSTIETRTKSSTEGSKKRKAFYIVWVEKVLQIFPNTTLFVWNRVPTASNAFKASSYITVLWFETFLIVEISELFPKTFFIKYDYGNEIYRAK